MRKVDRFIPKGLLSPEVTSTVGRLQAAFHLRVQEGVQEVEVCLFLLVYRRRLQEKFASYVPLSVSLLL